VFELVNNIVVVHPDKVPTCKFIWLGIYLHGVWMTVDEESLVLEFER
jgi:hypothetical protein